MWMPKGRWSDWLLPLAFVAILVTSSQATGSASQPAPINRNPRGSHNNSGIGDSELSASERSRRLIPYMAFYLPAPELPINQQYATKHSSSAGGAQLQAPLPGPGRIPVPVAYMPQQKHHPHHHGPPHPPPVPHYQSGAGEVYHSLAIGGHQHQHAPPQPPPGHVKEQQAITNSGATYIAYKPLNPTHKHKTVQHFPPLPPSPKEQVQQQQQQQHQHHLLLHHQQQQQQPQQYEILSPSLVASQAQRQRGKQSKINLTPFTAQNTLPGQFIPIIYTPVSSSKPGSPGDAINYNNIQSNLKQPEIVYKNSHQTQIVTDYAAGADASAEQSPPSSSGEEVDEAKGEKMVEQQQEEHGAQEEAAEQQQQQPQQHQQVQNNPSIGYASVSVPDSSAVTATTSSKNALIIHQKSPAYGHVSKYESYFNMAPPSTSLGHHPHQQHPHMTPQEKYVLYLQQRMKHQKHQQHLQQQQQQHYDFSHPVVPAQSNTLAGNHHSQHTHLHPHHPQTKTHHPNKYDALYVRPDATAGQQVLHIPLRALMAHVQEQSHSQSQLQAESQAQSPRHDFAKDEPLGSPAPPQFIDYLIDGPRQSLEDEQQHSQHERPSAHQPPQHAYILVTTTAPHIEHQPAPQMHPEISTPRPPILYNQQPTLRLQPVHTYKATRRPIYVTTPAPAVSPTSSHTHHEEHKSNSQDYDYNTGSEEEHHSQSEEAVARPKGPNKHPGPSTGRPGIDYPNYAEIPQTSFECTKQRYKGFFGDPETNCQVWHYCDLNGGKASFLCPNGTIFSQIALTCDWWFNVKCSTTAQLYVLNERLYKYILPFNPKFPEDYNGPIVDKYLAMKFQEMEEKMRLEKQRKAAQEAQKPEEAPSTLPALPKNHKPEPKHGSGINAQVYEQSSEKNLLIDDEIDDISERGTYDTYDQTAPTTIMAPTSTQDTQSFVLKPIVVSSTPQPLPEIDFEVEPTAPGSSEEEDHLQSLRETKEAEKNTRESTRVSVEKLEVIEIKTDGNTGQLMPIKTSSK
ncbi:chromatin modification-related protein eaf-1 isoform X3 [Drosophila sechellia]|uniref:chromatin modification-related protein eaf-1 isoform X3 n=1 Tax=Drosophila sechellia TaxID=7238 RepID=UPI0013DDBB45|nr:chromatin modification-related protein eaf-1 isoform X3 [Drosophila sechellia]